MCTSVDKLTTLMINTGTKNIQPANSPQSAEYSLLGLILLGMESNDIPELMDRQQGCEAYLTF